MLIKSANLTSSFAIMSAVLGFACGGGSDSEVETDRVGSATTSGAGGSGESSTDTTTTSAGPGPASANGSGGDSSNGSSTTSGGEAGSGGEGNASSADATSGGEATTTGSGNGCPELTSWTEAIHHTLQVTWPATLAGAGGTGVVHLWSRASYMATGNDLSVELEACGAVLPDAPLSVAGALVTGGETVLIEFPDRIWDNLTSDPVVVAGTQSGTAIGSTIQYTFLSLLGVTLDDEMGPWPESGLELNASDIDGDDKPGLSAVPLEDGAGTVLPPTGLGVLGSAPSVDVVYLVTRQGITIDGMRTACDAHSGDATVNYLDNHVVGCHIKGGSDCNEEQIDFVDQSRMIYEVTSASYEAKQVADGASCGEVRAAVP